VHTKWGRYDDDTWTCRNPDCDWYAYNGGNDTSDIVNRKRLIEVNPNADIWIANCFCAFHDGDTSRCPEHCTIEQLYQLYDY
jgi:hypothetical protein